MLVVRLIGFAKERPPRNTVSCELYVGPSLDLAIKKGFEVVNAGRYQYCWLNYEDKVLPFASIEQGQIHFTSCTLKV